MDEDYFMAFSLMTNAGSGRHDVDGVEEKLIEGAVFVMLLWPRCAAMDMSLEGPTAGSAHNLDLRPRVPSGIGQVPLKECADAREKNQKAKPTFASHR